MPFSARGIYSAGQSRLHVQSLGSWDAGLSMLPARHTRGVGGCAWHAQGTMLCFSASSAPQTPVRNGLLFHSRFGKTREPRRQRQRWSLSYSNVKALGNGVLAPAPTVLVWCHSNIFSAMLCFKAEGGRSFLDLNLTQSPHCSCLVDLLLGTLSSLCPTQKPSRSPALAPAPSCWASAEGRAWTSITQQNNTWSCC